MGTRYARQRPSGNPAVRQAVNVACAWDNGAETSVSIRSWAIITVRTKIMTVARITEISSVSKESFQDAIIQGIERANKTLKNVKGAWVKDQEVTIDNGKVNGYKVILKVTFILSD
jgi:dodecin